MESSTSEVSIEIQQQKIFALLHFVMECNRNHRLTSRVLETENCLVSIMKDAVLDSAILVDSLTVLSPSEDENEIANVPKEHVADNLPKFHPPRRGLSAVRSFPPGCGRGARPVRIQHGSKCLQNDGSRAKKRYFSAASPITHRTESEDHKILEDPMRKTSWNEDRSLEGKLLREFDKVESKRGELATGPEPTAKRIVVQGLMAAPNCPWRQGKRVFNSKPTNGNLEAFSRYAPLNVQPLKSDSLISADVKLALLCQSSESLVSSKQQV